METFTILTVSAPIWAWLLLVMVGMGLFVAYLFKNPTRLFCGICLTALLKSVAVCQVNGSLLLSLVILGLPLMSGVLLLWCLDRVLFAICEQLDKRDAPTKTKALRWSERSELMKGNDYI